MQLLFDTLYANISRGDEISSLVRSMFEWSHCMGINDRHSLVDFFQLDYKSFLYYSREDFRFLCILPM